MSTMMDIIFALILGAAVLLITLSANATLREIWMNYNGSLIVQNTLATNAQIIESEFRNMGCGVQNPTINTIVVAMDTCIRFCRKMRPDATTIDTIKYYSGSTGEYQGSNNPFDQYLYRQVNSLPAQPVGIITQFTLRYFDVGGDQMSTPVTLELNNIRIVEVTMYVQSPNAIFRDPRDCTIRSTECFLF